MVHIGYDAKSLYGLHADGARHRQDLTLNAHMETVDRPGQLIQHFTVGAVYTVRQVRVQLLNDSISVVDERLVDVDLRYGR